MVVLRGQPYSHTHERYTQSYDQVSEWDGWGASAKRSGIETRCVPYIEVAAARERARLRIKTRRAGRARLTPRPRRALVITLRAAGFHALVGRLDALLLASVGAVGVAEVDRKCGCTALRSGQGREGGQGEQHRDLEERS